MKCHQEMQSESNIECYCTPIKMAQIQNTGNSECWGGSKAVDSLLASGNLH